MFVIQRLVKMTQEIQIMYIQSNAINFMYLSKTSKRTNRDLHRFQEQFFHNENLLFPKWDVNESHKASKALNLAVCV